jgi:hypothetical protein
MFIRLTVFLNLVADIVLDNALTRPECNAIISFHKNRYVRCLTVRRTRYFLFKARNIKIIEKNNNIMHIRYR